MKQFLAIGSLAFAAFIVAMPAVHGQVPPPMDPLNFNGPDPAERFEAIEITQKLGAQVPLDLPFRDEAGNEVTLEQYLDGKPAILALVYYECPMLCNQILNGMDIALRAVKHELGEDYHAINISIDPDETPELAAAKKQNHLDKLKFPGDDAAWEEAAAGWHFLTGNEDSIDAVADTVGFGYQYDLATGQYAHSAAIMILTPDGVVSKYFYGIEYLPRNIELALVEASDGKIGTLVDQFVLLCYAYDPSTGQYGFYIIGALRVGAVLTLLALFTFWIHHWATTRNRPATA